MTVITHVGTVGVTITDQARARDFYTRTLGFETFRDEPMGPDVNWLEVAPPGSATHLVVLPPQMGEQPGGFTRVIFHTDDIKATVEKLKGDGVQFEDDLKLEPWGWWATFKDPDANTFGLWAAPTPS